MIGNYTGTAVIEMAVAALIAVAAIWLYRRRGAVDKRHGSQSAVLLLALAAIMFIHGSGLLEYRMGNSLP
jgi:hypothetical protein